MVGAGRWLLVYYPFLIAEHYRFNIAVFVRHRMGEEGMELQGYSPLCVQNTTGLILLFDSDVEWLGQVGGSWILSLCPEPYSINIAAVFGHRMVWGGLVASECRTPLV